MGDDDHDDFYGKGLQTVTSDYVSKAAKAAKKNRKKHAYAAKAGIDLKNVEYVNSDKVLFSDNPRRVKVPEKPALENRPKKKDYRPKDIAKHRRGDSGDVKKHHHHHHHHHHRKGEREEASRRHRGGDDDSSSDSREKKDKSKRGQRHGKKMNAHPHDSSVVEEEDEDPLVALASLSPGETDEYHSLRSLVSNETFPDEYFNPATAGDRPAHHVAPNGGGVKKPIGAVSMKGLGGLLAAAVVSEDDASRKPFARDVFSAGPTTAVDPNAQPVSAPRTISSETTTTSFAPIPNAGFVHEPLFSAAPNPATHAPHGGATGDLPLFNPMAADPSNALPFDPSLGPSNPAVMYDSLRTASMLPSATFVSPGAHPAVGGMLPYDGHMPSPPPSYGGGPSPTTAEFAQLFAAGADGAMYPVPPGMQPMPGVPVYTFDVAKGAFIMVNGGPSAPHAMGSPALSAPPPIGAEFAFGATLDIGKSSSSANLCENDKKHSRHGRTSSFDGKLSREYRARSENRQDRVNEKHAGKKEKSSSRKTKGGQREKSSKGGGGGGGSGPKEKSTPKRSDREKNSAAEKGKAEKKEKHHSKNQKDPSKRKPPKYWEPPAIKVKPPPPKPSKDQLKTWSSKKRLGQSPDSLVCVFACSGVIENQLRSCDLYVARDQCCCAYATSGGVRVHRMAFQDVRLVTMGHANKGGVDVATDGTSFAEANCVVLIERDKSTRKDVFNAFLKFKGKQQSIQQAFAVCHKLHAAYHQ